MLLMFMSVAIAFLSVILLLTLRNGSQTGEGIVTVLVLGDIGRSPRMSNHSISFANEGYSVQHVGYGGTNPHKNLTTKQNITLYHVMDTPEFHKCKLNHLFIYWPFPLSWIDLGTWPFKQIHSVIVHQIWIYTPLLAGLLLVRRCVKSLVNKSWWCCYLVGKYCNSSLYYWVTICWYIYMNHNSWSLNEFQICRDCWLMASKSSGSLHFYYWLCVTPENHLTLFYR